jgi:TctA family transporter
MCKLHWILSEIDSFVEFLSSFVRWKLCIDQLIHIMHIKSQESSDMNSPIWIWTLEEGANMLNESGTIIYDYCLKYISHIKLIFCQMFYAPIFKKIYIYVSSTWAYTHVLCLSLDSSYKTRQHFNYWSYII